MYIFSYNQVYLNWANTLLQEVDVVVEGITCLQEGKVICQLIDLLQHESDLLKKAQESESQSAEHYIQTAIAHMKRHGIRVRFTAQDILDGDVKSMLDVLWLIILNYGIHSIGRSAVERSVGVGKKLLLDWCQKELSADFDPRNTLSYNLCTGDWLLKLLKLYTDVQTLPEERGDQYRTLLQATEEQLGIKQNILNPADIVEGTVDEHTLMIYVSLLKRKVGGEEQLDISEDSLDRVSPKPPIASPASPSLERRRSSPSRLHSSVEADDNSEDWFSSSNGSIKSGSGDPPVSQEGESLLIQTITERVSQHIAVERDDEDDEESNVSVLSGSISQTSAPSKREVIDIDLSSQPQEKNLKELPQGKEEEQTNSEPDEDSTLKQALATAITENDILQAKLKNANSEIEEKMSKTNDVLNDCRTHLAKSQAENMELRTQLEKEKTRNDSIEARIRELDKQLATSKSQNDELERQLENMTTLLQGASKKDVPTIQSMAEERDNYKGVLANTQRENTQLKEKRRNQMFAEISRLQKQGQLTKVTGIISRYIDQGLYDDTDGEEDEEEPINGLKKSSHTTTVSSRGNSFYLAPNESYTVPRARVEQPPVPQVTSTPYRSRSESLGQNRRIYDDSFSTPSRVTPSRSASLNMSGIKPMSPSPASSHQRAASYDFEKSSPAASIGGHEIYPHRRSNSFRSNFTPTYDVNDDDNMDDLEVQKYLSKQPAGKLEYENDEDYNQQVPRKEFHRTKSPNVTKSPMGRGLSFSDLSSENKAKKQLLYSPYLMNKGPSNGLTNRSYLNHSPYDNTKETVDCIIESPIDNRYKDDYQKFSSQRVEYGAPSPDNDKSFLKALEHAVQQESNSIQKIYDELNLDYVPTRESRNTSTSYSSTLPRGRKKSKSPSPSRSSSGLKGILKNTKSETNLNIKEGRTTPVHRSTYSHSASPARTPTQELNSYGSRFGTTDFSSGKSGSSVGKSLYTTPIKRSASLRAPRDMYDDSLGTKSTSLRYKHQPFGEPPSLSDAERRYADLLVAKYTKQHGFGRTVML
ncbi:hypothetical protein FSP39_012682 [Pinctada imbricata]|uniref:Calponin-homology (CH) domain-containing protein n=1 Tax=Pinctada imbricata TaxID=66713 RepID=A0AA88XRV2_PINIB|nr:hypothetical protein FSP39_012682 [Pinctada imbricata]